MRSAPINAQGVVSEGVARKRASFIHSRLIDRPLSSSNTIGACLSFERRLEVTDLMRRPWIGDRVFLVGQGFEHA